MFANSKTAHKILKLTNTCYAEKCRPSSETRLAVNTYNLLVRHATAWTKNLSPGVLELRPRRNVSEGRVLVKCKILVKDLTPEQRAE